MAISKVAIVLATLVVPTAGLVVQPHGKTGCKKAAFLQRDEPAGDAPLKNPADSETIEGDDCGNVKQITGMWAKSRKVGALAGSAKAAALGAARAAKNTEDATAAAEKLGKEVGVNDEMPEAVKLAAEAAKEAATTAAEKGTTLETTSDTFSGKTGDFAKEITDADMAKIKEETEAAVEAAGDAVAAADRVTKKAAEAKKAAMNNADQALKLIGATIKDTSELSDTVKDLSQKAKHAVMDVDALITKCADTETKLDKKIADAEEQKPVWEAQKDDLTGRKEAAKESATAVTDAIEKVNAANDEMDEKAKGLQETKDAAQSAPNAALGQSGAIDDTEAATRKTETALATLKGKVQTMMKNSGRLEEKLKATNKKVGK